MRRRETGDHRLAARLAERDSPGAAEKIARRNLSVVDQHQDHRVADQRPEFFRQVECQRRPPITRLVVKP
jgi:hypothetical protein